MLRVICEGIFDLCIYVAVTSPYPRDWGGTVWYQSLGSHIFSTSDGKLMVKKFATEMHES